MKKKKKREGMKAICGKGGGVSSGNGAQPLKARLAVCFIIFLVIVQPLES